MPGGSATGQTPIHAPATAWHRRLQIHCDAPLRGHVTSKTLDSLANPFLELALRQAPRGLESEEDDLALGVLRQRRLGECLQGGDAPANREVHLPSEHHGGERLASSLALYRLDDQVFILGCGACTSM